MSFDWDYGKHWKELSEECRKRACYKCQKCGKSFLHNKLALHAHHVIPLSKGGRNTLSNLIAVCEVCHSKIHKREIVTSKFKNRNGWAKRATPKPYKRKS